MKTFETPSPAAVKNSERAFRLFSKNGGKPIPDDQPVPLEAHTAVARWMVFGGYRGQGGGPTQADCFLPVASFAKLTTEKGWKPDAGQVAIVKQYFAANGQPAAAIDDVLAGVGAPGTSAASSAPNSTGRDYPAESGLSGGWVSTHFPTRTENPQPRSFTPPVIDTPPKPSPTAALTAHLPKRFYADGQAIGAESAGRNVFADHLVVQLDRLKGDTFIESATRIQRDNEEKKRDRLSKIAATELAFRQR